MMNTADKKKLVLAMIAQGKKHHEIADELGVSKQYISQLAASASRRAHTIRTAQKLVRMHHWINKYKREHGYPPAIQELVDAGFAASTSVITYYFDRMQSLGMMERDFNIPRGIRLLSLKKADPIIQEVVKTGDGRKLSKGETS
jgi:SOS-response transcriptional repressor LexA